MIVVFLSVHLSVCSRTNHMSFIFFICCIYMVSVVAYLKSPQSIFSSENTHIFFVLVIFNAISFNFTLLWFMLILKYRMEFVLQINCHSRILEYALPGKNIFYYLNLGEAWRVSLSINHPINLFRPTGNIILSCSFIRWLWKESLDNRVGSYDGNICLNSC